MRVMNALPPKKEAAYKEATLPHWDGQWFEVVAMNGKNLVLRSLNNPQVTRQYPLTLPWSFR